MWRVSLRKGSVRKEEDCLQSSRSGDLLGSLAMVLLQLGEAGVAEDREIWNGAGLL